ncbi:MAG: 3-oxoacyl-ACP reductase FabG [candidate division WS1 bacterium]|nr:3-oxoacyl-ACP reductase FabG [candidate division WS1 bacterium]
MLKGKTALITGASRGLGAAIALAFAREGASIAVNYIQVPDRDNAAEAQEVVAQASQLGVDAMAVCADVTDQAQVDGMVAQVLERFGVLDIMVNNAGIVRDRTIKNLDKSDWDAVIAVNLTAAYNCIHAVVNHMRDRNSGRIISISSVVGQMGNIGQANYAASKAGLMGLTKSVAREVARRGITVNAIAPGFMDTEMSQVLGEEILTAVRAQIPMGYLGEAQDIADAAVFLASDRAKYITGQTLAVNGGLYM